MRYNQEVDYIAYFYILIHYENTANKNREL